MFVLNEDNVPQCRFLASTLHELLFGGRPGGGKSGGLRADPLRIVAHEDQRYRRGEITRSSAHMIYFRRVMPMLTQTINIARQWYLAADPGVHFVEKYHTFTFSSGAIVQFGHMEHENDWLNHASNEYTRIYYDELTEFLEDQYMMLVLTRLRTPDPVLKQYLAVRSATNPVGEGVPWVRDRFIVPAPPNTVMREIREVEEQAGVDAFGRPVMVTVQKHFDRMFIPSGVEDNRRYIGSEYRAALKAIKDRALWAAYNLGDWWSVRGAFLEGCWDQEKNVIPSRMPLPGLFRFRSYDYGYSKGSMTWWEVDHDGGMTAYHNFVTKGLQVNQIAAEARDIEKHYGDWDRENNCSMLNGPLDRSCFDDRSRGETIAETFAKNGFRWYPSDKDNYSGANQVRQRLTTPCGLDGRMMLRFMDRCTYLIRSLPALPRDKNDPEKHDTNADDHGYDDVRYACMSRPMKPRTADIDHDPDVDRWRANRRAQSAQRTERWGSNFA